GRGAARAGRGPAWPVNPPSPARPGDPPPADEEDDPQDEPADADDLPARDLSEVLREAVEALQGGMCVDVDVSAAQGWRAQCQMQLGGVEVKVGYDGAGHCYLVFALLPEAVRDLRAAQRLHNDSVIEWIRSFDEGADDDAEDRIEPVQGDEDDDDPVTESNG